MDGRGYSSEKRFGPFVPAIVEDWVPQDASPGSVRDVPAVLLFVDIVGFSKLSADLVAAHERGAEQTQRLLNALFTQLIAKISEHGGGVASIAGDSLQAYWTRAASEARDPNDLSDIAQSAALCAAEIMRCHSTSADVEHGLEIKAFLEAGDVQITVIGREPGRVFPILSGPIAESLPENSAALEPGKVLASPEFARQFSGRAQFVEAQTGLMALQSVAPPMTPSEHSTQPRYNTRFVPALTRAMLSGSDEDWVAEFRRATVLFAEFPQSIVQDPGPFAAFAEGMLTALAENGGAIVQFQTDDKGLVFVAAWGLAVSAFEDNAERAVHTGRALLSLARTHGMPCKIGISTGNVLCGLMGGEAFRQVAIMSEAVNLASALAARARSDLLVDPETMHLAQHRFTFADQGPFQPKGRAETLHLFTPLKETRADNVFGSRIIGRDKELAALLEAFEATERAPLVQIWGDAGLGKSHLGSVLATELAARGRQPVFGYCDSLRRASAFHVWRRPIERLLDAAAGTPASERASALADLAERTQMPAAQQASLEQVLDLGQDRPAALKSLSPEERGQAARDAIVGALEDLVGTGRAVLIFEDVHWMDSASWQVLADLRARLPQIAAVLLSRPLDQTDLPVQAMQMLRDDPGARLTLQPLGRAETDSLICAELGITEQPPAMLDRIFELAEGHPLYTKELAKLFVDRGLVHIDSGFAHIPSTKIDLKELQFPGGIAGTVSARVSALAPDVQLTLKVAAVQGRDADHRIIALSHPQSDAPIQAHLDAIHASGLMDPVSDDKSRFHHALIVDTAYALLLTEQRQELHKRIAELYETATAEGAAQIPSQLVAHHWDNGGAPDKALRHLQVAARQARRTQANAEVVAFLTRALELDSAHGPLLSDDERASLHMSLAVTLMSLGHLVATDTHMAAALAIFDKAPPNSTGRYLKETLGHYLRVVAGRRDPNAPSDPKKLNAARIYLALSEVYYDRQDTLRSVHATFSAMGLAGSSGGDSGPLATAMAQLSMVSLFIPWALNGAGWRAKAVEMAGRLNDPGTSGWVHMTTGAYTFACADFEEAERLTRIAIDSSAAARDHKCWEYSVANLGNILRLQGRFREADVQDVLTYDSGHDRGVPQVKLWGITGRMKNLWALGEFDAFEQSLARARSLITDDLNKLNSAASNTIAYHIFAALNALRQGDTEAGRADLTTAVDLYDGLKDPQIYMVDPVAYVLDAAHTLHAQGADQGFVRRVLEVMARKSAKLVTLYPSARARLELARGDLAAHKGAAQKAEHHWNKAIAAAEALQMPFDAAMAHHRLATRGTLRGAQADTHAQARDACLQSLDLEIPSGWSD